MFVKLFPRDLNLDSYFLYFTSTYTCREFLIKGLFRYRLLLKTENSKYYSTSSKMLSKLHLNKLETYMTKMNENKVKFW